MFVLSTNTLCVYTNYNTLAGPMYTQGCYDLIVNLTKIYETLILNVDYKPSTSNGPRRL